MNLLRFNNSSYYNGSIRYQIWLALGFAAFVFLFLFVFTPFGIHEMQSSLVHTCTGFALATFMPMVVLNVLIPRVFKGYFNEENWTVGREIIWSLTNLFIIGWCNYYFYQMSINSQFSWKQAFIFQGFTIAVGIFPISALALIRERKDRARYTNEAIRINEVLADHEEVSESNSLLEDLSSESDIEIPSLNTAETLVMKLNELLVMQAADNYLDVYYLSGGRVTKAVIRNTLKSVEESLAAHKNLFRCHKSYLVNLHHVHHISGNAQGYKLHVHHLEDLIPVSRAHNNSIKERIAGHP